MPRSLPIIRLDLFNSDSLSGGLFVWGFGRQRNLVSLATRGATKLSLDDAILNRRRLGRAEESTYGSFSIAIHQLLVYWQYCLVALAALRMSRCKPRQRTIPTLFRYPAWPCLWCRSKFSFESAVRNLIGSEIDLGRCDSLTAVRQMFRSSLDEEKSLCEICWG
jgi:hypothetical protein